MQLLLRSFGQFLNNTMVTLTWCSFGFTLRIPKHLYRQLVRVIIPFVLPSFRNGKRKKKRKKEKGSQNSNRVFGKLLQTHYQNVHFPVQRNPTFSCGTTRATVAKRNKCKIKIIVGKVHPFSKFPMVFFLENPILTLLF